MTTTPEEPLEDAEMAASGDPVAGGDPGAATKDADGTDADGTDGDSTDATDGDNIFQRGLSGDPAQWKLSADGHKAQCFIKTTGMTTPLATPPLTVGSGWYRAVCRRANGAAAGHATLTMTLRKWNGSAWVAVAGSPTTAPGNAYGALDFPAALPVSVGGKLRSNDPLELTTSPDQFNGIVDNVRLTLG